jgi:hypothetical protein
MLDDPLIGVFTRDPTVAVIAELFEETSARYLFRAWLQAALETMVGGDRDASQT